MMLAVFSLPLTAMAQEEIPKHATKIVVKKDSLTVGYVVDKMTAYGFLTEREKSPLISEWVSLGTEHQLKLFAVVQGDSALLTIKIKIWSIYGEAEFDGKYRKSLQLGSRDHLAFVKMQEFAKTLGGTIIYRK